MSDVVIGVSVGMILGGIAGVIGTLLWLLRGQHPGSGEPETGQGW